VADDLQLSDQSPFDVHQPCHSDPGGLLTPIRHSHVDSAWAKVPTTDSLLTNAARMESPLFVPFDTVLVGSPQSPRGTRLDNFQLANTTAEAPNEAGSVSMSVEPPLASSPMLADNPVETSLCTSTASVLDDTGSLLTDTTVAGSAWPAKRSSDACQTKEKLFVSPADYRRVSFGGVTGFGDWLSAYGRLVSTTQDTPMAESVQKQTLAYVSNHLLVEQPGLFEDCLSVVAFGEKLDEFIDSQLSNVQLSTVVNRLRFIRWYYCYLITTDKTSSLQILHEIDDTIGGLQTASTNHTTNKSLLNVLDPYRLAQLSNRLVRIIENLKQTEIDPFLLDYFQNPAAVTRDQLVGFGLDKLRIFLELAMRLTNVPLRVECTKYLRTDKYAGDDFVSKLVLGNQHISRLVMQDKTGKFSQITTVPLDSDLSGYLLFYLKFCRPKPESSYVFQSKNGGVWRSVSKDLKEFLDGKGVNCAEICPNGRLIHGTRNMGLAVYAILSSFDIEKIRNYATLMRHQLIHVEHIYSPWLKMYQNKAAVQDLIHLRKWEHNPFTDRSSNLCIANLTPPNCQLRASLVGLLGSAFAGENNAPEYKFKDAATQTADPDLVDLPSDELTNQPSDSLPQCTMCFKFFDVLGPCGLSRSPYFGQFFRQCTQCHGTTQSKTAQWYKLGVIPTVPSASSKPRNLAAVVQYVKNKTGVLYAP
jgi:hypothetical protein